MTDIVIVGSGLFGLTVAERCASQLGLKVLVLEKRSHIGGNAYSEIDPTTGIEVHKYGSHIFHTSNEKVWSYVNQFTSFNNYQHRVWTSHNGQLYPMPINLETINKFFDLGLTSKEAEEFMSKQGDLNLAEKAKNLEDRAIGLVGSALYEAFIKNYTLKQWQTDPRELPADIINRLPIHFTSNHRYFRDKYEGIPLSGYSNWLSNMASHPNIEIRFDTDFLDVREEFLNNIPVVFTGPIDQFYEYRHGPLAWRTLDFENQIIESNSFQDGSVINYADLDVEFTRIHEFKHFHPERTHNDGVTIISREYSRFAAGNDEPYYPVNTARDRSTLRLYRNDAEREAAVIFGGRLGSYQYLDMHMAIASALVTFENTITRMFK